MNKRKWFEFTNSTEGREIHIYGPIVDEKGWWADSRSTCPTEFNELLAKCNGEPLTIRINSGGGSVFAAHAIYNKLKDYKGDKTVIIDGLAASAATVIASAGNKIVMPNNALFMIHNPLVYLDDNYQATDLIKMTETLNTVRSSIVNVYTEKTGLSKNEVEKLMDAETWMDAETAKAKGFIDEIKGEANITMKGDLIIVNSISHDVANYKNFKNAVKPKEVVDKMPSKAEMLVDKVLGYLSDTPATEKTKVEDKTTEEPENKIDLEAIKNEAIKEERARIQALEEMRDGNPAVEAIINTAKAEGKTVEDVKAFVDALKGVDLTTPAQALQNNAVEDSKNSGADEVIAEAKNENEDDGLNAFINALNSKMGGKK